MKSQWTTIRWEDEERAYKFETHTFKALGKKLPWQYCNKCGLVAVRNKITEWCITKGCNNEDHPQYKETLKRLTSLRSSIG